MARRPIRLVIAAMVVALVALLIVVGSGRTDSPITSPTCLRSQLRVAFVGVSGGLGHEGRLIRITNVSGTACSLTGYPKVTGIVTAGVQKNFKDTVDGYLGGLTSSPLRKDELPVVTLPARRGVATSMEESVLRQTCPSFTSYVVSLPHVTGGSYTFHLHWTDRYCFQPEVHPLLPGRTESADVA